MRSVEDQPACKRVRWQDPSIRMFGWATNRRSLRTACGFKVHPCPSTAIPDRVPTFSPIRRTGRPSVRKQFHRIRALPRHGMDAAERSFALWHFLGGRPIPPSHVDRSWTAVFAVLLPATGGPPHPQVPPMVPFYPRSAFSFYKGKNPGSNGANPAIPLARRGPSVHLRSFPRRRTGLWDGFRGPSGPRTPAFPTTKMAMTMEARTRFLTTRAPQRSIRTRARKAWKTSKPRSRIQGVRCSARDDEEEVRKDDGRRRTPTPGDETAPARRRRIRRVEGEAQEQRRWDA